MGKFGIRHNTKTYDKGITCVPVKDVHPKIERSVLNKTEDSGVHKCIFELSEDFEVEIPRANETTG